MLHTTTHCLCCYQVLPGWSVHASQSGCYRNVGTRIIRVQQACAGSQAGEMTSADLYKDNRYSDKEQGTTVTLAFLMAAGNGQDTIIWAHSGDHQHLLAHILHHSSEEVPADAVKVMQVLQHDGQGAICCHKLFQHLNSQLPCQAGELCALA